MKNVWYKNGLKFKCKQCGRCCTGSPGYVFLSEKDLKNIAYILKISIKEVINKYCRLVNGNLSLKEMTKTYDCIFLQDNKCRIYKNRPVQCKTFPFWPYLLESKKEFDEIKNYCKGSHETEETVDYDTIQKNLNDYLQNFS